MYTVCTDCWLYSCVKCCIISLLHWMWQTVNTVHSHSMYTVCTDPLSTVCETSWDTVRFIECDKFLTIKFNLFICIWNKNSSLFQIINYKIFTRPSFTPTQITYTTNLQPIHSISINLHSSWPHYKQPRSHSSLTWLPASILSGHYKNFILLVNLLFLVEVLVLSGCCTALYVTFSIFHVPHAFQWSAKQTIHWMFLEKTLTVQFKTNGFEPPSTEG